MTRANTTPWWPPANRSPPGCWRSCCKTWASTRAPGRAGNCRSTPAMRMARRAFSTSTAPSSIKRFKERKEVAVIAGFQGIHKETGRITTLGRGGSDTSAVAIAAAIQADRCDIYTDVDGVYTTDPRVVPKARRLDKVAFEEMLELASLGAKVLQVRSVELGMVHKVRDFRALELRQARRHRPARQSPPGTLICGEEEIVEQQVVTGIAFSKDEAQISIRQVAGQAGRRRRDLRPARRSQHQRRHDRAECLRRRQDHRPDLHRAGGGLSARHGRHRQGQGRDRLSSGSTARPTSPRSR